MNNKAKRGISSVIAVVLIILITIAAITIVWQVIVLLRESSEAGIACENARTDLEIVEARKITATDEAVKNSWEIRLKRGNQDAQIDGLVVYFYDSNGAVSDDKGESFKNIIDGLEEGQPFVNANEIKTYPFSGSPLKGYEIAIAPVVGGKLCDILPQGKVKFVS